MRGFVRSPTPQQLGRQVHLINIRLLGCRDEELYTIELVDNLLPLRSDLCLPS